jgi:hypothetical protein
MFSPDPMPVEVISAFALVGVVTELIALCVHALDCSIYRQIPAKLKQAAYQPWLPSSPADDDQASLLTIKPGC